MKNAGHALIHLLAVLSAVQVGNVATAELPAYHADQAVHGEIRIWGSPADG